MLDHLRAYTEAKLDAVLREISSIEAAEFPHEDSRQALVAVRLEVAERKAALRKLSARSDQLLVKSTCREALHAVADFLPLMGFVLRSTNVRNAFELHGPLLRLSRWLVGVETRLVISSEWEFSPFAYKPIAALPDFVLIGLPASESSNGLLLPLSGHELGHAVWEKKNLRSAFTARIQDAILDAIDYRWTEFSASFPSISQEALAELEGQAAWRSSFEWAVSQAKESFCDFMGVRIFGESFLFAFAYLVAPGFTDTSPDYPKNRVRAANILRAAIRFGTRAPEGYEDAFFDPAAETPRDDVSRRVALLTSIAEDATASVVPILLDACAELADRVQLPSPADGMEKALAAFRLATPASEVDNVAAIVNAGWQALHDDYLWVEYPQISERKAEVLNELLLKSVEVLEIEQIRRDANA